MIHKKLAVVVLTPFLLLCLLIVRAEVHINQGEEWQFQVQGYDPRDLLRGHYLRFSLRYDWEAGSRETCNNANDCCLCLTDTGETVPKVKKISCAVAKNQCDGYMRDEFARDLNRYYIPENQAAQAEKILRDARIESEAFLFLSINRGGKPLITDLMLRGESLEKLIKQKEE